MKQMLRAGNFITFILACVLIGIGITLGAAYKEATNVNEESIQSNHDVAIVNEDSSRQGAGTMGPFWKVSHNDNTVYMLGSIHVAKPDLYPLHDKVMLAFEQSDVLAVEADILNINLLEMQQQLNERALYTDGSKLSDHLPPYVYAQVKKTFADYNINIALFERYEPWYISMLLDGLHVMKLGYDEKLGVDLHFLKRATGSKEIVELEGITYQLDLFDRFSEDVQLMLLKGSINGSSIAEEEFEQLFEVWKSGDAEKLNHLLNEHSDDSDAYKEYTEALIDRRNKEMATKIDAYLTGNDAKTYFVVVGAAHYVGDTGIVKLLEERGYTVEKQEP